jgi:hypothetical protein
MTAAARRLVIAMVATALAGGGCAAEGSAPAAPVPHRTAAGAGLPSATGPARPERRRADFTVRGSVPVAPSASQDTHALAPGAVCQPRTFRRDKALGRAAVASFTATGAPVSARLLTHFLAGRGTAVNFGAGSQISRQARASRAFRNLNRRVQAAMRGQLTGPASHVRLPGSAVTTVRFGLSDSSPDLYLGFRGTQGVDVRGAGTRTGRRYAGRLTYVIRDSYGFTPQDQLLGVGSAMRYLQTTCGNPPVRGGAHWFPDSITVIVPFRHS